MALMTGSPPNAADQVHLGNWRQAPACRWAFNHVREIVPAAPVFAARTGARALQDASLNFDDLPFVDADGEHTNGRAWAERMAVDAVTLVHGNRVLLDSYADGQSPHIPHILMSVSKSVLGLVTGAVLAETGTAADTVITDVLPELRHSAWAGATLQHALDMQISIAFDEDYLATDGAIIAYRKAQGWNPLEAGEAPSDLRQFFPSLRTAGGQHGERFHYVSPNTDMMAWALERIAGLRYSDLLSDLLWRPMGAEDDAYITVDRLGAPRAAGGLCTTARDLARLGLLVAERGAQGTRQVLPEAWVADTLGGGSRDAFASGNFHDKFPGEPISYRNYCYWHAGAEPFLFGIGIHGQAWVIDPARALVLVVHSSHGDPQPPSAMAHVIALFRQLRERAI